MKKRQSQLELLAESAKLTGRIDLLMEMRDWLDEKIKAAEAENKRLREKAA